jgi:hypothetical protein
MSVFIVQVYEDVLGVFSTREKAEAYISSTLMNDRAAYITEAVVE